MEGLDLRFISESVGVQPSPHRHYSLPRWIIFEKNCRTFECCIVAGIFESFAHCRDMVDLASGNDPSKLVDFLRLQGQLQGVESGEDDDDD